jgi:hypothetical protein
MFSRKERPKPGEGTDLSAMANRQYFGHRAAARSDRRAVHDAACRVVPRMIPKGGSRFFG